MQVFTVEHGILLRHVSPRRGKPYVHACRLGHFETIAHYIQEAPEPFKMKDIHAAAARTVPWTPIAVALAFLFERGLLERTYGRRYAPGMMLFEDAMVEFHALAHECEQRAKAPPPIPPQAPPAAGVAPTPEP